jgi:hypothetical protein
MMNYLSMERRSGNRRSEQISSATTRNLITLCDDHGSSFVTVTGQILMVVHSYPAEAMQPDGSALAPMSAAGTGYQAPAGVAPFTVVPGKM